MVTLNEMTLIHASRERCFDLPRSIDLHKASTARSGERAVAGVTEGLIGLGEEVTWRARHLAVWQRMTVQITAFDRPNYFQDRMIRGAFRYFEHDHFFADLPNGDTRMKDVRGLRLRFRSPDDSLNFYSSPISASSLWSGTISSRK